MFIQEARGKFQVEVSGPHHCGLNNESPKTFDYEVRIEYGDSALDERGFLLDNLFFMEFFHGIGRTELSCEKLTREAARQLLQACRRARLVEVTIYAVPGVAMIRSRVRPRWLWWKEVL